MIGNFRTRILWQSPLQGQDDAGQPIDGWTDVGPDWADFRVLSGLEAIKADAVTSVTRASCRVRYREDLTPDMRAMVAGEALTVVVSAQRTGGDATTSGGARIIWGAGRSYPSNAKDV